MISRDTRPYLIIHVFVIIFITVFSPQGVAQKKKRIKTSESHPPGWITNQPPGYFVGISGENHSSENDARQTAVFNAGIAILNSLGIDIRKSEASKITTEGAVDDILDSDIHSVVTIKTDVGSIIKLKGSRFYWEKYQRKIDGRFDYTWKYYALVRFSDADHEQFIRELVEQSVFFSKKVMQESRQYIKNGQYLLAHQGLIGLIQQLQKLNEPVNSYPPLINVYRSLIKDARDLSFQIKPRVKADCLVPAVEQILGHYSPDDLNIALVDFHYRDKNMGSEFSRYLKIELEAAINHQFGLSVHSLSERDFIFKFLSASDTSFNRLKENGQFNPYKKQILKITGNYWESDAACKINILSEIIETGERWWTQFELPISILPDNMHIEPLFTPDWLPVPSRPSESGLRVRVFADKETNGTYSAKDLIRFFFVANRDCFVYLFRIKGKHDQKLLFPNQYDRDNAVVGYRLYSIPEEGATYRIRVKGPAGIETVRVYASEHLIPSENIRAAINNAQSGLLAQDECNFVIIDGKK